MPADWDPVPPADTLTMVRAILTDALTVDEARVLPGTGLHDLGATSLDRVEIAMSLEDAFGVTLRESDLPAGATVGDVVALIERLKTPA